MVSAIYFGRFADFGKKCHYSTVIPTGLFRQMVNTPGDLDWSREYCVKQGYLVTTMGMYL